ncbi:MAG: hypothetical protein M3R24_09725 [Chloroflexota bacterium]|nr:hypothetical protein [Chloroflexota bacterium]
MSNAILAQSISQQTIGLALRQMRQSAQYNSRELNAVNRAALNIAACVWQYDGEHLVIESATTMHQRYHVAHTGCDCKAGTAGRECWHMAAFVLLNRAAELALTPAKPRMTEDQYAAAVAACDDLF